MTTPSAHPSEACRQCGAAARPGANVCWLCGAPARGDGDVNPFAPPAEFRQRATDLFQTSALLLVFALAAGLLGVYWIDPITGLILTLLCMPALAFLLVTALLRRSRGLLASSARGASAPAEGLIVAATMGVVILAFAAGVVAFFTVCVGKG